jgi:radical SAM protein with 4Fe4S-binding SPASM domain
MMAEYNHDTANLANRLSIEETAKVIEDIINGDEDYQRAISYRGFEEVCKSTCFNPDRRLCGVGISSCAMVSNGNVYPCPGWQDYIIGNLTKNTLEEIWASSPKIQYLRGLTMKDLGNGKCCKCENAAFCSPCLVRNANESPTGDPLEINSHFCKVAKLNKDIVLKWRKEHNCE